MKKLKSQSGRSMVEMLGVLAIIGVLSVGGIAGYSLSMRRHRANQVVDFASKYALIEYDLCQKRLMSGEIESVTECSSLIYSRVGKNSLPSGVGDMTPGEYTTDENTGVDTIKIGIYFFDEKLCQAVASIGGTSCEFTAGTDASHTLWLSIKQN